MPYSEYPKENFDESKSPDITAWRLARAAIEHENNLIHHRLTWFFAAQAFLLTAFFSAFIPKDGTAAKIVTEETSRGDAIYLLIAFIMIGLLGIYISAATSNGLRRAYIATDRITGHYVRLATKEKFYRVPPLHLWTKPSLFNILYAPNYTMLVWVALEIVTVKRYSSNFPNLASEPLTAASLMSISALALAIIGVGMSIYTLIRSSREKQAENGMYWDLDPHGRLLEDLVRRKRG